MIDSHCHLDFTEYEGKIARVLERAAERGVSAVICIGTCEESSHRCVEIASDFEQVWASVGIHPHGVSRASDRYASELIKLARSPRVLAIGETGLDYYRRISPAPVQQKVFREHIRMARELNKPAIVHCRDAHDDVLAILEAEEVSQVGGIMHCFSGDMNFARRILDLDMYISIAGPVTYPNSARLREVVKMLPLDRILVETDAPFLTPQPYRGKRNEPAYIHATYEHIALIKQIPVEVLINACRLNAFNLLGLSFQP